MKFKYLFNFVRLHSVVKVAIALIQGQNFCIQYMRVRKQKIKDKTKREKLENGTKFEANLQTLIVGEALL